jgi:hypothetical protein
LGASACVRLNTLENPVKEVEQRRMSWPINLTL